MDDIKELLEYSEVIDNCINTELRNLVNVDNNAHIYHYTDSNAILSMISNKSLRFTSSQFLNDSTEVSNIKLLISNILDSVEMEKIFRTVDSGVLFKDSIMSGVDMYLNEMSYETFLISFTLSNGLTTMWYGYADGDGYCLAFEKDNLLSNLLNHADFHLKNAKEKVNMNLYHGKVIYDDKIKNKFILFFLGKLYNYYDVTSFKDTDKRLSKIRDDYRNKLFSYLYIFSLYCKDSSFQDENEFRFIYILKDGNTETSAVNFRTKKGAIIPYIEIIFQNEFPLHEIEIGPKVEIDFAQKGLEMFLANNNLDVNVKKSKIPLRF